MLDASRVTIDTSTGGFLWYAFSKTAVLPEDVAVAMIVNCQDCKELREVLVCTGQIANAPSILLPPCIAYKKILVYFWELMVCVFVYAIEYQ